MKSRATASSPLPAARQAVPCRGSDLSHQTEQGSLHLAGIVEAIVGAESHVLALQAAVTEICQHSGWDYAEIWVPTDAATCWRAHPYWFGNRKKYLTFRDLSEQAAAESPLPLVQRVGQQQTLPWYADVSVVPLAEYRRAHAAKDAGLKATFALPVVAAGETCAVLVFMTAEVREQDARLVALIAEAASRLVRVFQTNAADRPRAQPPNPVAGVGAPAPRCFGSRLRRLSPRQRDVFQLTLDGLTAAEIAERLGLSHRTVEVHRASLLRKLKVSSTTKLLAEVLAASLDDRPDLLASLSGRTPHSIHITGDESGNFR